MERYLHTGSTACGFTADGEWLQPFYRSNGLGIDSARSRSIVIVREVGRDQEQGFVVEQRLEDAPYARYRAISVPSPVDDEFADLFP